MSRFEGAYMLPGIQAAEETFESEVVWGRHHPHISVGDVIGGAARDAGNSPTDVLRPGLLLGKKTSDSKLYEWNPAGTDGTERIFGILLIDQKVTLNAVNKDRYTGPILVAGTVKASRIIVPGAASAGINGSDYEMLIRALLTQNGRFILDDEVWGSGFGSWSRIIAKTADYAVLEADNNTLFTNEGDADAINFTLPTAHIGYRFGFMVIADFSLMVTGTPADSIVTFNDPAADSVQLAQAGEMIGGFLEFIAHKEDGWLCIPHLYEAQTVAIVT